MAIQQIATTGFGPLTDWAAGVGYRWTATPGDVHEFTYPATPVAVSGQMVMAVKVVATALTTGTGTLKLSVRRGVAVTDRRYPVPRETSYTLTAVDTEYEIVLSNLPFPEQMSTDDAWNADGSDFDDYAFGIEAVAVGAGQIRVSEIRLDVVYRPTITLEDIFSGDNVQLWQWSEIEGVPYIPSTQPLPEECGSYYYGLDRRPIAGIMVPNEEYRSGKISHAKGREEIESANITLLNVNQIRYETDADLHLYPQGFLAWLLAYGDRTNIARTRMTDSTGVGYNSIKGLDPKDWSGVYGRRFTVASTAGFPAAADVDDSYCYVGREAIWYGLSDATSFGDDADTNDLQRGQFGSMDTVHEYERFGGVYPEVTERPVTWNGRWVKIWFCPIDESTGYPFPRSMAIGHAYMWGTHEQSIGPSKNNYKIKLSKFESILKRKIPNMGAARVKGLNMASAYEVGYGTTGPPTWVELGSSNHADIDKLCRDVETSLELVGIGSFRVNAMPGGKVKIRTTAVTYYLLLSHDLSAALGFGSDRDSTGSSPSLVGTVAGLWKTYDASEKYATSFVSPGATKIYVQTDDTEDWPTTLGSIGGSQTEYIALLVGDKDDEPICFYLTATGSDADGDFLTTITQAPPAVRQILSTRKRLYTQSGDSPIQCQPMMVIDTVEMHNAFLRMLTSTGFGNNGTYDIYPKGFGGGIDERLIDTAAWVRAGQLLSPGSQFRVYFLLDDETLEKLIEEELKWPSSLLLRQGNDGTLSLVRMTTPLLSDTSLTEILPENVVESSTVTVSHSGLSNIVNNIVAEIDYNPFTEKYMTKLQSRENNSIREYGEHSITTKHRGIRSVNTPGQIPKTSTPHSVFMAQSAALFDRWSFETPQYSLTVTMRLFPLDLGDKVSLTLDYVGDATDALVQGLDAKKCEILKANKNLIDGKCSVILTHDQLDRRFSGYAPSAVVTAWNGVTFVATVSAHEHTPSTGTATDASYFAATDKVVVVQFDSDTPLVFSAEIASVSGNDIEFTAGPGGGDRTPTALDYIIYEDYDTQAVAQLARFWAHVSSAGYVDVGNTVAGNNYVP